MGTLRDEYSEFLQEHWWDYFGTVTFRSPRREPYYALKNVYSELKKHNVARAFMGVEPHSSGDLHIHGLFAGANPAWKPWIDTPWQIQEGMYKRFGISKIEVARSSEQVAAYCSKYILKGQNSVGDHYNFFGSPLSWREGLTDHGIL